MKPLSFFFCLLCFAFAGCDTMPNVGRSVREKFTGTPARTQVFAADQRTTYDAARSAAEKMGFKFVRGGPAQGELEAVSGLASSNSLRGSRQLAMTVRLASAGEGATEIRLWLKEIIEDDSTHAAGRATESPLRDTPLYEVFFRNVQQALGE